MKLKTDSYVVCIPKDALVGLIKTKPKKVSYGLGDIGSVELITGWFRGFFYRKLKIQFKSITLADKLPGNKINEVKIDFKRKDLKKVRQLVEEVNYSVDTKKLDEIDRKFLEE